MLWPIQKPPTPLKRNSLDEGRRRKKMHWLIGTDLFMEGERGNPSFKPWLEQAGTSPLLTSSEANSCSAFIRCRCRIAPAGHSIVQLSKALSERRASSAIGNDFARMIFISNATASGFKLSSVVQQFQQSAWTFPGMNRRLIPLLPGRDFP